jgi:hypothetical protein
VLGWYISSHPRALSLADSPLFCLFLFPKSHNFFDFSFTLQAGVFMSGALVMRAGSERNNNKQKQKASRETFLEQLRRRKVEESLEIISHP